MIWPINKIVSISQLKNDLRTYDNTQKIRIGQGDDDSTGCLLDYNYFKDYYKMAEIDLNKQQPLDIDPKAIPQINLTRNLAWDPNGNTSKFFIIEEAKETILDCSQGTMKVLQFWFALIQNDSI